jgi:hypothetical protein
MDQQIWWGANAAVQAGANPKVLMLGDSWLWYPVGNLPLSIAVDTPSDQYVVVGSNGADAADWDKKLRKHVDFAFKMFGSGVSGLLLSGGGNDIVGMADFLRILKDDCSGAKKAKDCYREGQPDAIIAVIIGAYKAVIIKFRAFNKRAPVLMHNYDYAWPTGQGFFGPADWLKAPMDFAKVPDALRREVFRDLIKRLHAAQDELATDKALKTLVALKSAGTLPDAASQVQDWWANELHPTPAGFKRLAEKVFTPAIQAL